MKILILTMLLSAYAADSSKIRSQADAAEIRENTKRNAQFRKLAADSRIAASKQQAFFEKWGKDCEAKGLVLSVVVPGDGRLDCISVPKPPPPTTGAPK